MHVQNLGCPLPWRSLPKKNDLLYSLVPTDVDMRRNKFLPLCPSLTDRIIDTRDPLHKNLDILDGFGLGLQTNHVHMHIKEIRTRLLTSLANTSTVFKVKLLLVTVTLYGGKRSSHFECSYSGTNNFDCKEHKQKSPVKTSATQDD